MTKFKLPPTREIIVLVVCLGLWLAITATFVGFRPEHPLLAILVTALFCLHPQTKKLVIALMPFVVFAVSYDWMNICPNYKVNPIDVQGLYEAEKSLFGISTASGVLTPTNTSIYTIVRSWIFGPEYSICVGYLYLSFLA